MVIADAAGRVVAAAPSVAPDGHSAVGLDITDRPWFQQSVATRRPFIDGQVVVGLISGVPLITVNAPIVDGSGRLRGVVSGGLGLEQLQAMSDRVQLGRTGRAQIASAEGFALAHWDRSLVRQRHDYSGQPIWHHIGKTDSGQVGGYLGTSGERRLAGYATVRGLGWKVWVSQSLSEVEGDVRAAYAPMVVWAILALVAVGAVVVALTTVIVRPIRALQQIAGDLGRGDFERRATESGPREIGALARAFNQMAAALAQHERSVSETTTLLNGVLDSATDYSIVATSLDGAIVSWNEGARRMYGHEAADAIGRLAVTFERDDVESGRAAEILAIARERGKWEGEMRQVRADGTRFTAHLTITPRRGPAGAPVGLTTIARDLTTWQRIERDLRRSELRCRHPTPWSSSMPRDGSSWSTPRPTRPSATAAPTCSIGRWSC
jgi:PAS domain S-box-containing protein